MWEAFAETGGNFVDTANEYTGGTSERIELGFPHEFLQRDSVKGFVYGGLYDRIDNHRPVGPDGIRR